MTWRQKGICVDCGAILKGRKTKFCSKACEQSSNAKKWNEINGDRLLLPTATIGAIGEHLVGVDLLKRGHHVYRALSASAPGDLAVIMNGNLVLIEVTTGTRSTSGKLMWPAHNRHKFDVLAVIEYNGTITYTPELPAAKAPADKVD